MALALLACAPACTADATGQTPAHDDIAATSSASTTAPQSGFVWANGTTGTYPAPSAYSYNSTGGTNRIVQTGTGAFRVEMPGLGAFPGGNVQVVAYDTNARCKVAGWGSAGTRLDVNTLCHSADGALVNAPFVMVFEQRSATTGTNVAAYVWSSNATASQNATAPYSYNSKGGTNRIERLGVGNYDVVMPGLNTAGGNVQVTAYGHDDRYCKINYWLTGEDTRANVRCFAPGGAAADALFTLSFEYQGVDLDAFVWANGATSPLYTPNATFAYNPYIGSPIGTSATTASRTSLGNYALYYDTMTPTDSAALVTAYGASSAYCTIGSWLPYKSGNIDGTRVNVRCYTAAGALADTQFSQRYVNGDVIVW